jgi:NAD(P)-dependent dehydrogenase (short-subunit alcohol dehydrogenase family)
MVTSVNLKPPRKLRKLAIKRFGSIDAVVANAGIFLVKPFTELHAQSTFALWFRQSRRLIYITSLRSKQMQLQKSGGSVVSISARVVDNPIAGLTASVSMITKGGLNAITRSLASEYAKEHIRFNAVAPGVVDTPLHGDDPKDSLKGASPMGLISTVEDVASAGRLSNGSSPNYRGGAARGRRCAHWQMVTAKDSAPASAETVKRTCVSSFQPPPEPFGAYVEAVQTGNLLFLTRDASHGRPRAKFIGRVGAELDVERRARRLTSRRSTSSLSRGSIWDRSTK